MYRSSQGWCRLQFVYDEWNVFRVPFLDRSAQQHHWMKQNRFKNIYIIQNCHVFAVFPALRCVPSTWNSWPECFRADLKSRNHPSRYGHLFQMRWCPNQGTKWNGFITVKFAALKWVLCSQMLRACFFPQTGWMCDTGVKVQLLQLFPRWHAKFHQDSSIDGRSCPIARSETVDC